MCTYSEGSFDMSERHEHCVIAIGHSGKPLCAVELVVLIPHLESVHVQSRLAWPVMDS